MSGASFGGKVANVNPAARLDGPGARVLHDGWGSWAGFQVPSFRFQVFFPALLIFKFQIA